MRDIVGSLQWGILTKTSHCSLPPDQPSPSITATAAGLVGSTIAYVRYAYIILVKTFAGALLLNFSEEIRAA